MDKDEQNVVDEVMEQIDKSFREVNLDADQQCHFLVVICEYLNYMRLHPKKVLESDDTDPSINMAVEMANVFYLAGHIEGRCLYNHLSESDVELIEAWEEELIQWHAEDEEKVWGTF